MSKVSYEFSYPFSKSFFEWHWLHFCINGVPKLYVFYAMVNWHPKYFHLSIGMNSNSNHFKTIPIWCVQTIALQIATYLNMIRYMCTLDSVELCLSVYQSAFPNSSRFASYFSALFSYICIVLYPVSFQSNSERGRDSNQQPYNMWWKSYNCTLKLHGPNSASFCFFVYNLMANEGSIN